MRNGKKLLFACLVVILLASISSVAMARAHTHWDIFTDWSDWRVRTPATCEATGVDYRVCKVWGCHEEQTRTSPALDHKWDRWETTTPSTCTVQGLETRSCTRDGCNEKETRPIDLAEHKWSKNKQTTLEPTCTDAGSKAYVCSVCQGTKNAESIPALRHDWSRNWVTTQEPTCTEKGTRVRSCTRKDCTAVDTDSIDAKGHNWSKNRETIQPPTCTEKGREAYTCSRCDATKDGRDIPALRHDYGPWTTVKQPTCTEQGLRQHTCKRCPDVQSDTLDRIPHTYTEWQTTKPATCTERGVETEKCAVCGHLGKKTRHIDRLPHEYEWIVTRAATCYLEGEETETCKNCGATNGTRAIPKLPHTLQTTIQPSTCERKGLEHIYCTVPGCGYVKDTQLPALDHIFEWIVVTKPTLNKKGLDKEVCSMCGLESGKTRETDKLGDVYANNTLSLAGARVKDVNASVTNKWYMIAPIDLTKDGVTKLDVVVGNQYIIGKLIATVKEGTVTFELKMLPSVTMAKGSYLTLFASLDAIQSIEEKDVTVYELKKPLSIADDLAGAQKVFAFFFGRATYDRMADGVVYYVHNVKAANAILGK